MISCCLQDCLTNGNKRPAWDASQDWHVTKLTENDGITTMEFCRLRNTNDAEGDNVIDVSCKFFLENIYEPLKPSYVKQNELRANNLFIVV